uniref:Uncharacterized protein n=1 Tax=Helicotheca tamesis TaxID=374047 RepID=A0A7S2N1I0_9STRA|mmetsp:Transcript_7608/g.10353  ORF Transcript_7608/g.10353 Transcript_7608/m.10353 type:complete len:227 (+) Transcript_7608:73-753(+)
MLRKVKMGLSQSLVVVHDGGNEEHHASHKRFSMKSRRFSASKSKDAHGVASAVATANLEKGYDSKKDEGSRSRFSITRRKSSSSRKNLSAAAAAAAASTHNDDDDGDPAQNEIVSRERIVETESAADNFTVEGSSGDDTTAKNKNMANEVQYSHIVSRDRIIETESAADARTADEDGSMDKEKKKDEVQYSVIVSRERIVETESVAAASADDDDDEIREIDKNRNE